jgi:hypothetical protein
MTTPKRPLESPSDAPSDTAVDPPPTAEELQAAIDLRDALEDPSLANEDAALLRALALAETPRPLGQEEHRAILEDALARPPLRHSGKGPIRKAPGRVLRVSFGASAALAVAAAVVLFVKTGSAPPSVGAAAPLAAVRSTQPLFHEPFAREGGESARVDRIALARAGDFRDNEFRRWGVR